MQLTSFNGFWESLIQMSRMETPSNYDLFFEVFWRQFQTFEGAYKYLSKAFGLICSLGALDQKLPGDLFKYQKLKKYPFRKRKGLLFPGCESFREMF